MANDQMSMVEHLEDLRRVIIVSFVALIVSTIVIYAGFRDQLMELILKPMHDMDLPLVYITMTEAFLTHLKASFFAAIFVSMPIIIWQVWSFVLPALYAHERKYIVTIIPVSMILFVVGVLFSYFMVFPLAARFLIEIAGEGLSPMISVSRYLSFLISFSIPFGIVFQLPLIVMLLTKLGIVTPEKLAEKRKYALFAIIVLSATLTPPDIISLSLMAGPVVVLYEVSIILAKIFYRKKKKVEQADDDEL
ncbi:sec-independent protein translocase protein TatC [Desulfitispora alkaliphila]|uniref:twin-arginine translocase subunit TatC n=1 Tax=Desulfitispora alkaliphila TaxID=622674 RepID=UPI003D21B740